MPSGNPLANLLVVVVGVLTIAMSVVIGFFAFVALAGFVLIVATVVGIRTWWLRRNLKARRIRPAAQAGLRLARRQLLRVSSRLSAMRNLGIAAIPGLET